MMDQNRYLEGIRRIKDFANRAQNGEKLSIGFFGGSITQGSLASIPENCYAYRVYKWFCEKWPCAKFHYINAGIGGTSSLFGTARVHKDMLMYRPDLVIVDFSVNDEPDDFFKETYEGLIRRIWYSDFKPAVILLNNVYYDTGKTAQDQHDNVGDYYGIPHVSIRDTIYQQLVNGDYVIGDITPDGLHPNDFGHALLTDEITRTITEILENDLRFDDTERNLIKEPITGNGYENAERYTIENCSPQLYGFKADCNEKCGHLDFFKNGWIGSRPGDRIIFKIDASCIAVQYRKTVRRPAAKAKLIVDNDTEHVIILDSNFDEDWGDCLYIEPILHHAERCIHTLEIEIDKDTGMDVTPFYLLSVIAD